MSVSLPHFPSRGTRTGRGRTVLLGTLSTALLTALLGFAPGATAEEPNEGKPKEGAPKDGATKDDYVIDTSGSSPELKVQGDGTLAIHIKPKEGLKVHPQAPLEVRLTSSAGVKPAKTKLGRKDVTEQDSTSPELRCALRGEVAGDQVIEAELSFFLCSESWCQRMKDKVAVPVKVVE